MSDRTLGEKAADFIAHYGSSWRFVITFNIFVALWMIGNDLYGHKAIDPFPFILLNLGLSWLAGVQAPIIMMSQKRQEKIQLSLQMKQEQFNQEALNALLTTTKAISVLVTDQRDALTEVLETLEEINENNNSSD